MHKAASVGRRIEAFSVLSGIAGEQHYASCARASDGPPETEKAKEEKGKEKYREKERQRAFFLSQRV